MGRHLRVPQTVEVPTDEQARLAEQVQENEQVLDGWIRDQHCNHCKHWLTYDQGVQRDLRPREFALKALPVNHDDDESEDGHQEAQANIVENMVREHELPDAPVDRAFHHKDDAQAKAIFGVRVVAHPDLHELAHPCEVQQLVRRRPDCLELALVRLEPAFQAVMPVHRVGGLVRLSIGLVALEPGTNGVACDAFPDVLVRVQGLVPRMPALGTCALALPAIAVLGALQQRHAEHLFRTELLEAIDLAHVMVVVGARVLRSGLPREQPHRIQEGAVLALHRVQDRGREKHDGQGRGDPEDSEDEHLLIRIQVVPEKHADGCLNYQRPHHDVVVHAVDRRGHEAPHVLARDRDPTQVVILVLVDLLLAHLKACEVGRLVVGGGGCGGRRTSSRKTDPIGLREPAGEAQGRAQASRRIGQAVHGGRRPGEAPQTTWRKPLGALPAPLRSPGPPRRKRPGDGDGRGCPA
mmetsp:Transcript_85070/g.259886  ORF Transcript_85070/g.259886 Transcript_85070/m.259886 type:complete len:466 (-) Transcript_85070:2-1399(-)